jgi:hypothetical protein
MQNCEQFGIGCCSFSDPTAKVHCHRPSSNRRATARPERVILSFGLSRSIFVARLVGRLHPRHITARAVCNLALEDRVRASHPAEFVAGLCPEAWSRPRPNGTSASPSVSVLRSTSGCCLVPSRGGVKRETERDTPRIVGTGSPSDGGLPAQDTPRQRPGRPTPERCCPGDQASVRRRRGRARRGLGPGCSTRGWRT